MSVGCHVCVFVWAWRMVRVCRGVRAFACGALVCRRDGTRVFEAFHVRVWRWRVRVGVGACVCGRGARVQGACAYKCVCVRVKVRVCRCLARACTASACVYVGPCAC